MSFWIAAAILTVLATLLALLPLLRRRPSAPPRRAEHDLEVYGAQLAELSGDLDRGTIDAAQAASARAEIGRRLIAAAAEAQAPEPVRARAWTTAAALGVGALVPAVALGGYALLGAPAAPDMPLAARALPDLQPGEDFRALLAASEARLRENPDDGRGWELLAPIYQRLGEGEKAETAYRNAIRLLGETPERQVGLGEARTQAAGGEVTDEALAAFRRALALDPAHLPAKFFLALDLSQENRNAEALAAWTGVIDASPPDAPWLRLARSAAADAQTKVAAAASPPVPALPGPSGEAVAAAAGMGEDERRAMIEGMVTQLAARLRAAPNDVEGWKRLMRSYAVIGAPDKAREAFAAASGAFAEGSAERRDIAAFWQGLGIDGEGSAGIE